MKVIIRYLYLYKYRVFSTILLIIFLALIQSAFPLITKILIDDVFGDSRYELLSIVMFMVGVSAVLFFIFNITKQLLITYISQKIVIDIKTDLTRKIRELSFSSFNKKSVGEYLSIFQSDLNLISNTISIIFPELITIIIQLLITVFILVILNPNLLLLAVILIPINLVVNYLFLKPIYKISMKTQHELSKITEKTKESLINTKEIIGFSRKEWDLQRLYQVNLKLLPVQMKKEFVSSISSNFNFITYWVAFLIIVYFGGKEVQTGGMSLGTLIAFITYLMGLFSPISILLNLNIELQKCMGGAKKIFDLYEIKKDPSPCKKVKIESLYPITFENVTYLFSNGNGLKNININVEKGETIALIGNSGEGKSTLINLLLGLYHPQEGKILINGIDTISSYPFYLDNIAVVFQENNLFTGTIKENIQFGDLNATQDEIVNAAKMAGADEFIEKLPLKYDTIIGEGFANLSGGQKQRIAIARALVRKPQLLILDEATSALDYHTEKRINFITNSNQSTIIITHRLENLKGINKIYNIKDGNINLNSSYEKAMEQVFSSV